MFFTRRIEQKLDAILEGVRKLMAMSTQITALLQQFDAATNAIAARLAALSATRPDDPELVAALTSEVARLQGLAADPANPVPPEPAPLPSSTPV